MNTYKIVRRFFNTNRKRVVAKNLTLDQAQAWCQNPQTSSSTCTDKAGKARTKRHGRWFDGYTEEK